MMNVEVVVKVGGGLLKHRADLDRVLAAVVDMSRHRRLVIVPGGGPFADAVRVIDDALDLPDGVAHWMAIRAMDEYAHLITDLVPECSLAVDALQIESALMVGFIPVLAPYRWLRDADPLPHSWDVTSDSIAAWVAGAVGAHRLVLIKPSGASGPDLVDAYFQRALSPDVTWKCVPACRTDELELLWPDEDG
jgi:aspartokinase-like uncharacterized kinase